jgi:hypothetical protein
VRAPGRRGALSPEEAAHALGARRDELRAALDRRHDARVLPAVERDELVAEAIGVVVMSRRAIRDEHHLEGAYWRAVGWLLAERRAGRHELRLGSRRRVDFEPIERELPGDDDEPFDVIAARDRIKRAADLIAQLDPLERRVLTVMSAYGLGIKLAARALGEPVKTVLAAARSADRKLEQVAVIAAAGRMCEYRLRAIHAHAEGTALEHEAQTAKAHIAACSSCRGEYTRLLREMRGREFKRAASAAFLPPVVIAVHGSWVERLSTFLSTGRAPSGGTAAAERTAGVLGGGGLVKAAAVTSALVVAGAGVGARVIHSLTTTPTSVQHRHKVIVHRASKAPVAGITPTAIAGSLTTKPGAASRSATRALAKHVSRPAPPPSHADGYLALGGSADESSSDPRASAASAATASSSPEPTQESSPPPTRTGGGTNLNYLGQ